MAGLLDFLQTPQGQGLLSGVVGYAANARRGTPINNLGRGGMAGLMGYNNAISQQEQAAQQAELNKEREQMRQVREMQIAQARTQAEREQAQQQWRQGLPQVLQSGQAQYGAGEEGPTMTPGDPNAVQQYLMRPESPIADELLKQRLLPKQRKTITVGNVVLDAETMRPLYEGPQDAAKTPTKVQEYEYAKANGYKGTFDQYVTLGPTIMAAAQAPLREAQIENITRENEYNLPPAPRPRAGASGPVTVTVGNRTYSFPDQKSANNFKMKAGVK